MNWAACRAFWGATGKQMTGKPEKSADKNEKPPQRDGSQEGQDLRFLGSKKGHRNDGLVP